MGYLGGPPEHPHSSVVACALRMAMMALQLWEARNTVRDNKQAGLINELDIAIRDRAYMGINDLWTSAPFYRLAKEADYDSKLTKQKVESLKIYLEYQGFTVTVDYERLNVHIEW